MKWQISTMLAGMTLALAAASAQDITIINARIVDANRVVNGRRDRA